MTDSPHDAIPRYQDELTEIRSDLHANPKLGLEEHRTSDVVAAKLAEWGIEVHRRHRGGGRAALRQRRAGDRLARRHGRAAH